MLPRPTALAAPLAAALVLVLNAAASAEEFHKVARGNLTPKLEIDGVFEAEEAFEVRLRLDAYAGDLRLLRAAGHGEAVRAGEPVLAVDPAPLARQLETAEADLKVARAALAKAEAEQRLGDRGDALALAKAEHALRAAATDLQTFDEIDGKHLLERADLDAKSAEDHVSDLKEELDQLEKMYASEDLTNATSEIVVRRTRRQIERAGIPLKIARERAARIRGVDHPRKRRDLEQAVEAAAHGLEALKAAHALDAVRRAAETVRARAAVAQQEEQLGRLRGDRERLAVAAPFDGRVLHGQWKQGAWANADAMAASLRAGEKLPAGQVLLTVCRPALRVRVELPESHYFERFRPGAAVAPAARAEASLEGEAVETSFVRAGKGNAYETRIRLKQQLPELLPGMGCRITLSGEELRDVLCVPAKAVSTEDGRAMVKLKTGERTEPREVKTGKSDGRRIQILEGLAEGDEIALPKAN